MEYKVLSRSKLPRNKYGDVKDKERGDIGNQYFSSGSSSSSGGGEGVTYKDFVGATNTLDGKSGLVPAPKTNNDESLIDNDQHKFLKGSGAWTDIPISRYTTENTNKDGINLNGNLTVSDAITTQTLNVLGSAHFWELVIDKVKAAGGNLLITPANFIVDYVGDTVNYNVVADQPPFTEMFYYPQDQTGINGLRELFQNQGVTQLKGKRLYMKNSDGTNDISSEVVVGDMVRCKTLNLDETNGFTNKDYWTFVLATGTETYNSESCLYIDVLYQYVSNGTTYGLGTTINYDSSVLPPLEYHNNDLEIGIGDGYGVDKVFIASSDISSGNCYLSFEDNDTGDAYYGDITWDGTKWNFSDTGNSISPNTTMNIGTSSDPLYNGVLECIQDSRFSDPIIKITDVNGCALDCFMGAYGVFYITDKVITTTPALESFKFGYGTFSPETGDNLVTLGHLWEGTRQGAILISSYDPLDPELEAPAIGQYKGIRTFTSISPYRITSIAANGNTFLGKVLVNYNGTYMDIDEKMNLYVSDITTGLEKVGIHIDGENSTIKMIGSVEIRQNSDGIVDTLTVWDTDDIMRVKISPEQIPNKSNISTEINPTSSLQFRNESETPNYTTIQHHQYTEFIWTWDHRWWYEIDSGGYITCKQYCNIGTFNSGQKISVSNLYTNFTSKAYYKNQDYISTRSTSSRTQSISSIILRLLRKNGSSWTTVNTYNLTNTAAITIGNENAYITYNGSIISNYTLTNSGSYRLQLEFVYVPYAKTGNYDHNDSNWYINFNNSYWSTIQITQPSSSMTRIGNNGIVFNTENVGQYFYSGNDGIEMKWGDAQITMDSTYGLKTNGIVQDITSSTTKYIASSTTIADCRTISSDTTIYLPNATYYGKGRILTIIGNDYITISTNSGSQYIRREKGDSGPDYSGYPAKTADGLTSSTSISMTGTYTGSDGNGDTIYYRRHNSIVKLMSTGDEWIKL